MSNYPGTVFTSWVRQHACPMLPSLSVCITGVRHAEEYRSSVTRSQTYGTERQDASFHEDDPELGEHRLPALPACLPRILIGAQDPKKLVSSLNHSCQPLPCELPVMADTNCKK